MCDSGVVSYQHTKVLEFREGEPSKGNRIVKEGVNSAGNIQVLWAVNTNREAEAVGRVRNCSSVPMRPRDSTQ